MKALRTAALVVGAVALVVATAGAASFVAAGAIGAGFGAGSIAAVGLSSTFLGVSAGTLLAASAGLAAIASVGAASKKPKGINGGSQTEFSADPRAGVPYALGRTGTKGNIVFRRSADGWSNKTPNDLMDIVTVFSGGGPIHGFESFTSDKTAVTFDGSGNAIGTFRDYMFQKTQLGACPEASRLAVTAGISAAPTGWTTAHKLSGLAAAIWRMRSDSKTNLYPNGVPDPLWVLFGLPVYDPRQDSTYPGGSGACRWDDETTWVWDGVDPSWPAARNPYLQGLSWCIGRHQNGKRAAGLGANLDQIIVDQFVEAANICDANGWTVSGVIYSRPDTKWNNLKLILQAGGGEPLPIGARIGCRINTPRVSLATITREDIVGNAQLATTSSRRTRINTVIPRGRSEANGWEIVPHDPVQVADYVTEDGDERTREIEWPLVDDKDQLAQLAAYEIVNSREFGPGTFPLKPVWIGYKPGDCLTLDIDDVADQKILVTAREPDPQGLSVTLTVQSETDAKHPFALGQTLNAPPTATIAAFDPSVAAPDAGDWTLAGGQVLHNNVSIPALIVEGAIGNAFADAVIFDQRVYDALAGDEDNWVAAGVDSPHLGRKEITGVGPSTQYEVSLRYRAGGVIGARLILGPVTAGEWGAGVRRLVSKTVNYPLSSDDDSISVAGFTGVTDTGLSIAFPADTTTLVSLASGSVFDVFWDIAGGVYLAGAYPDTSAMANPGYVYIGTQATSTGGVYDSPDPPPPGTCVTEDTPVLLADGSTVPAGELTIGMVLRTKHEHTLAWGDYAIAAIAFADDQPVYACELTDLDCNAVTIRATANHLFLQDNRWVRARDIGTPDGTARVAKITVTEAHTYVSANVLSHNIKPETL